MAKIFMVRVCETVSNLEGKISNLTPLTPNGIKQSRKVRDNLKPFNICSVYSSKLESASKTAEIIAEAFGLSVVEWPEFNETDLGDWDGMEKRNIENKYKIEWKEWLDNPTENWRFPGAKETLREVQTRVMKKFKEIVSLNKEDDMLCIVTHGNIIRIILCSLLTMDLSNILKFHQFNGAITALEYDGYKTKILFINDVCHLHSLKFAESITGKPWTAKRRKE